MEFKIPFFGKKTTKATTSEPFFMPLFGNDYSSTAVSDAKLLDYYLTTPELNAIISTKAKMSSNMKLNVVIEATGEIAKTHELQKLLHRPNFYQGMKEFLIQRDTYRSIYGNEYIYALKGIGAKLPTQLTNLNPVGIEYPDSLKDIILFQEHEMPIFNYKYEIANKTLSIPNEDVIHINNPSVKQNTLKGESIINANLQVINNIRGAYESRGMLIDNKGATGILTNNSKDALGSAAPMDQGKIDDLQKDYLKYGYRKGQHHTIITSLPLTWQKMGSPVKDLMLFEEIESGFNTLLGDYGLRREIFPTVDGATFENQKEAEKASYVNTIIPEANEFTTALDTYFGLTDTAFTIKADYSHLPVFADDLKEKGLAMKLNVNALTEALNNNGIDEKTYKEQINNLL